MVKFIKCTEWPPSAWMHNLAHSITKLQRKNYNILSVSCNTENLLKELISCVQLEFMYHIFHVTPHM